MLEQPDIIPVELTEREKQQYGVPGDLAYRLEKEYRYMWCDEAWRLIIVPKGLIYDGASVPRVAWTLSGILPDGLLRAGALVHDYLYMNRGSLPPQYFRKLVQGNWQDCTEIFSRRQCDRLFAQILKEADYPAWKITLAYWAIRTFGWYAWVT